VPFPRIGFGYDVHRLVTGRPLILGGVQIPFERGLEGHSDADVLLHAIIDALLGATALGDIGRHFPDTDERYRNISSLTLLSHVARLLTERGFSVVNVDATLVLERPKIAPHVPAMRKNIAGAIGIGQDRVAVKATTSEGMGFAGSGEGAAAHAVAAVVEGA
jgi:2-C-methyl-D-erythritol 2,4-cyclodiphosphate synthase